MSYTASFLTPVSTAALARIDAGTGPAQIVIKAADNTVLANLYLTEPAGSVGVDGILTLTSAGPDTNAPNSGTATYADFLDGNGVALATNLPVQQGNVPVSGVVVITSLNIVAGGTVSLSSLVLG